MTSKIIVNTIEADTGISSVTFASNINLQNDSSVLVSSSGIRLGTGSTIAAPSANEITLSTNSAERLRVDSAGRLLLGTTTAGNGNADNLTLADSGNCGITIRSGTSNFGEIYFSDATSGGGEYDGWIAYSHSSRYMVLATAQTERLRIDAAGTLLVNSTIDNTSSHGVIVAHAPASNADTGYKSIEIGNSNGSGSSRGSTICGQPKSDSHPPYTLIGSWDDGSTATVYYGGGFGSNMRPATTHRFYTNSSYPTANGSGTERLRITSAGNVGINETNPIGDLSITGANGSTMEFQPDIVSGTNRITNFNRSTSTYKAFRLDASQHEFLISGTEKLRITSAGRMGVGTNDPAALLEVRDSENTTQGNAQIRISKGVGNGAAPTSVSRVNSYLHIGGSEYHTSFGKYNIAFGYTNDEVGSGIPAYIGFTETTLAGYTKGDLIFGTRGTTGATDNPTERMRIDSNGVITMPAQPAFHSRGGTTLSASTNNVIIGGATEFNTGGHYSTSNGRFTAPVDGVYQFSFWGLLYVHSSGVINIFYTKNGTQYAHIVQGGADSTNHTSRSGTVLMGMSAGDYAELRINPASTGANAYTSQWNMSGHLIG